MSEGDDRGLIDPPVDPPLERIHGGEVDFYGAADDGVKFLFVGGLFHGTFQPVPAGVSTVYMDEFPLMAYHRTYVTSTVVFEWHEREWVSPAVQAIREAVK
jgi:hypothetical protein